jgi:hypothetical protein
MSATTRGLNESTKMPKLSQGELRSKMQDLQRVVELGIDQLVMPSYAENFIIERRGFEEIVYNAQLVRNGVDLPASHRRSQSAEWQCRTEIGHKFHQLFRANGLALPPLSGRLFDNTESCFWCRSFLSELGATRYVRCCVACITCFGCIRQGYQTNGHAICGNCTRCLHPYHFSGQVTWNIDGSTNKSPAKKCPCQGCDNDFDAQAEGIKGPFLYPDICR